MRPGDRGALSPLVALSGFVTAVSGALWFQLAEDGAHSSLMAIGLRTLLAGLAGAGALLALRRIVLRLAAAVPLSETTRARYERRERWTYVVFALTGLSAFGMQLIAPVVLAIATSFLIAQAVLLRPSFGARVPHAVALSTLFALSGAAALMYQVVWQRLLFGAVGANIESVTLVVSIFMLGLGVGSLLGGRLSTRYADRLPGVFAALELSIAVFGAASISLISFAGRVATGAPLSVVALTLALLLLIPTLLMGATLPVLVAHVNRTFADVGRSVGTLYFANTLGSAAACFVTVLVLFAFVGLRATVYVAVCINFSVAILVNVVFVRPGRLSS